MTLQQLKELWNGMVNEMDMWKKKSVEQGLEIETLKEDVKTYKKYHSDKCNECEEQRERADYNEKEIMRLKREKEELKEKLNKQIKKLELQKQRSDKQQQLITGLNNRFRQLQRANTHQRGEGRLARDR